MCTRFRQHARQLFTVLVLTSAQKDEGASAPAAHTSKVDLEGDDEPADLLDNDVAPCDMYGSVLA